MLHSGIILRLKRKGEGGGGLRGGTSLQGKWASVMLVLQTDIFKWQEVFIYTC